MSRRASLALLLTAACASQPAARPTHEPLAETCSSVTRAGLGDDVTARLEQSSNVLDYENIWRDAHPGITTGTISGSEVRARIRSHMNEIYGCYETAFDRLPEGRGRVVVRFVVDADGGVPTVSITSNDIDDRAVGCCVAKRVAAWTFPKPTNGEFVVVEYPFTVRMSRSQ